MYKTDRTQTWDLRIAHVAVAHSVSVGVTDLDQGVSGILTDSPANAFAY